MICKASNDVSGQKITYSVTIWDGVEPYGNTLPKEYKTSRWAEAVARIKLKSLGSKAHAIVRKEIEFYKSNRVEVSFSSPYKVISNPGYVPPDL